MNYEQFVMSRFKDGVSTIQDISSAPGMHIQVLHASIGMMGEWIEIQFAKDRANIKEELGDFWFYLTALKSVLGIDSVEPTRNICTSLAGTCSNMLMHLGDLLDTSKKISIYNKELDNSPGSYFNGIVESIHYTFLDYIETLGFSVENLEQANKEKLTQRYPIGYSNQAAQDRADKGNCDE